MKPYKNRVLDPTKPVKVYRNLNNHRSELFSIQQNGLVIGHANEFSLEDVSFEVSEAGRQRVIKEGRKNVHCFAVARSYHSGHICDNLTNRLSYNPYKSGHFQCNGQSVFAAKKVNLTKNGVYI